MEDIFCNKTMPEEMKDNIEQIIMDSFKNKNKDKKKKFIYQQLGKLYPDRKWGSIFINKQGVSSWRVVGILFTGWFKERLIIIQGTKRTKKISTDDSSENEEEKDLDKNDEPLKIENNDLKDKLNNVEETIKKYESKIEELNIIINKKNNKIESLENEINKLKAEIERKNNPFNQTFYTRDQMIALNFISSDDRIKYAIPCLIKDLFVDVEKKIYEKFPQYREENHIFLSDGNIIKKFKTVGENKLQSGIPIIMKV
jgi:DNA repair exonuclease SbcCD ATPase subunit